MLAPARRRHARGMNRTHGPPELPLELVFAAELRIFLPPANRAGPVWAATDGTFSLGHVVESAGVPLTEVGVLLVNGKPVQPSYQPRPGDRIVVHAIARPQRAEPGFLLDVHLGALARRMRLLGLDTAYSNDLDDDALIELANATR